MNKRIRYRDRDSGQEGTGVLVSTRHLTSNTGATYQVMLDLLSNTFKVLNSATLEVIVEGKGTSPHKVKIKAKDALSKLGVSFESETRGE